MKPTLQGVVFYLLRSPARSELAMQIRLGEDANRRFGEAITRADARIEHV
jgi:hypothetical protein